MSQEQGIKNPRAKALWDKWRHVWMMAWERDRRLKDKLNYLQVMLKTYVRTLEESFFTITFLPRNWSE